jgi:hypothetical protein
MSALIQRRALATVRRDAVEQLSNGRVRYSALFSRIGIQTYGKSVEYRPPIEVFDAASMASGDASPGVLLHPDENFDTSFGPGAYPIRGATGIISQHSDGIHTAGDLVVWDAEWNGLIETVEVAELSVGYTITPDPTPGVAPDGTAYDVVHRRIVWDHVAGVAEGNAGSARVIVDARARAGLTYADRRQIQAMREVAAPRLDARPIYHDLGAAGPRRKKAPTMPKPPPITLAALAALVATMADGKKPTPKIVHDAMIKLEGDTEDPAFMAMISALAGASATDPPPSDPATADPPAADPAAEEQADKDAPAASGSKMDAAVKKAIDDAVRLALAAQTLADDARTDAADTRADVLEVARVVFSRTYDSRKDGKPKSTAAIMREVLGQEAPERAAKVDAMPESKREACLEFHFAEVRADIDDRRHDGQRRLQRVIAEVRGDKSDAKPTALDKVLQRVTDSAEAAGSTCFGSAPPPSA